MSCLTKSRASLLLAALLLFGSSSAVRASSTGFQINGGVSTFKLSASSYSGNGGIGLEMRPQINFEFNSLNAAIDVFYQGRLGSSIGSFPLSRVGGGLVYYPTGLPLQTQVMDNGVTMTQNHFAPFLVGNMTFTTVAITDKTQSKNFNGLAIGYQIGGGGEMPLSQTWSVVLTFYYEGTLSGGSSSTTDTTSASISISGAAGFLGIAIHP